MSIQNMSIIFSSHFSNTRTFSLGSFLPDRTYNLFLYGEYEFIRPLKISPFFFFFFSDSSSTLTGVPGLDQLVFSSSAKISHLNEFMLIHWSFHAMYRPTYICQWLQQDFN